MFQGELSEKAEAFKLLFKETAAYKYAASIVVALSKKDPESLNREELEAIIELCREATVKLKEAGILKGVQK
jgi:hypothetical protein